MQPFTAKVIETIQAIPPGKVMTYGQIAKVAGSPRGARQVVRILHSMTDKYNLPWHRVINAKGIIAITDTEGSHLQKELLEKEGVTVSADLKVELAIFQLRDEEMIDDRAWDTI